MGKTLQIRVRLVILQILNTHITILLIIILSVYKIYDENNNLIIIINLPLFYL